MTLAELINYWKARQKSHPPMTPARWQDVLSDTVAYLEELQDLKKGGT